MAEMAKIQVTHGQLISCLRQYADDMEAMPDKQHVEVYQVGGCNERLFECGLWIRAEVNEEQCLSRVHREKGKEAV